MPGNSEIEQTQVIKEDKTDPVITTLHERSTFTLNEVINWSASDALSGLATETNGTIDTSTVGPKQLLQLISQEIQLQVRTKLYMILAVFCNR